MSIFEYDEEKELRLLRQTEYQAGVEDGETVGQERGEKIGQERGEKIGEERGLKAMVVSLQAC